MFWLRKLVGCKGGNTFALIVTQQL